MAHNASARSEPIRDWGDSQAMMRLFLLVIAAIIVPPALSYGINPAAVLPKTMIIAVDGTDQTEMLRAVMGLYLGMSTFCAIAAFKPEWRYVAVIWAVFFLYSIAAGRILSLIVDGMPSPILLFYMAVELTGGTVGLYVLARERRKREARR
jgi:Domain of unknown function (DUF4345)